MKKIAILVASLALITSLAIKPVQAKTIDTNAKIKNVMFTEYGYYMNVITSSGDTWGLEICEGIPFDKNILKALNTKLKTKKLTITFDDNNTKTTDDDEPLEYSIEN